MAIQKSRLGRGLGSLIAGGISGSAKPSAPKAAQTKAPSQPAGNAKAAASAANRAKQAAGKGQQASKQKPAASKQKPAASKPKPAPAIKAAAKSKNKQPVSGKNAPGKPASVKPGSAKPASVKPVKPAATPAAKAPVGAMPSARAVAPAAPVANAERAPTANAAAPSLAAEKAASASVNTGAAAVSATNLSTAATAHTQTNAAAHAPTAVATPTTAKAASASAAAHPATTAVAAQGSASAASHTSVANPYREIPVSAVVPNPYQPRRDMDAGHIAELADSIASEGLLQPIVVRPIEGGKSYELIAGERRWRAHQKLGLKIISARVMDASDSSSAVISLIENIQREALNPIEEALGFASLMRDFDLTQEAVAERLGRARASIANSLRLLALDREIQGYVGKGILSVGHAKILLGVEEPAQRLLIARRIIEGGISVRETEVLVKRLKNEKHARQGGGQSTTPEADRTAIADLEKQLSSRLNTRVQLHHTPKKGRIVIEYYGNEDLQRILEHTGLQL